MAKAKTMREQREELEGFVSRDPANKDELFAIVPKLVTFMEGIKIARQTLTQCASLATRLAERCANYLTKHPSVCDDGISTSPIGVQSGDVTIEGETYHMSDGFDGLQRKDGGKLTQSFLSGLPKRWIKSILRLDNDGLSRAGVDGESLSDQGLERKRKVDWTHADDSSSNVTI